MSKEENFGLIIDKNEKRVMAPKNSDAARLLHWLGYVFPYAPSIELWKLVYPEISKWDFRNFSFSDAGVDGVVGFYERELASARQDIQRRLNEELNSVSHMVIEYGQAGIDYANRVEEFLEQEYPKWKKLYLEGYDPSAGP